MALILPASHVPRVTHWQPIPSRSVVLSERLASRYSGQFQAKIGCEKINIFPDSEAQFLFKVTDAEISYVQNESKSLAIVIAGRRSEHFRTQAIRHLQFRRKQGRPEVAFPGTPINSTSR